MVLLQHRRQAAQHADRLLLVRLVDLDRLEAALEGGVGLEVLLVLGPGGGRDGAQLAAGQGRLEQVGGVALARPAPPAPMSVCASSMNRMIGIGDAFTSSMHRLRAGSRTRPSRRRRPAAGRGRACGAATFLSGVGHVAGHDPQGEPFDHGRLADAGLAGEDRVVLPAAGEDVDDLADLDVAADDRVDLAGLARSSVRLMVNWSSAGVLPPDGAGRAPPVAAPRRPARRPRRPRLPARSPRWRRAGAGPSCRPGASRR